MKLTNIAAIALPVVAMASNIASARGIKEGYVDAGATGTEFPAQLVKWEKGQRMTDDDNFFISRVKPKMRFRNQATQVDPSLDESNDKKLIFWVPVNNETFNALPDGVYDSEVFPCWSYITHYGNWSTRLVRMPGAFSDVAHKNGVPVSVVASIPFGNLNESWQKALTTLVEEVGAEKMADFLEYYGVDGLGYNSEFAGPAELVDGLGKFHARLVKLLKDTGRMPLAEMIWYDGTQENGGISFDNGLTDRNDDIWGYGDSIRTSLFFNYNWNYPSLLQSSVEHAEKVGRTPLDLYCGINMQGREPHNSSKTIWPYLKEYPLSIGLWGAHSQNMFFESRAEKGPSADARQRSYLLRMEKWFTGGTRNPVNSLEINNSLKLGADNDDFFGMSKFMSARSALSWDLSEEPFISFFNLGNGKFFNFKGERKNDKEWYNIGVQDYLPTWMWWFSGKFLGRDTADLVKGGLSAEFVWDDAWLGGSLVRVHGSTPLEYLHLFKTEFALREGDVIRVRYKRLNGSGDIGLVLSAKGEENIPVGEDELLLSGEDMPDGIWIERRFTVGKTPASLAGKELAVVALRFKDARDLDIRLGEFSITRPGCGNAVPAMPRIERAEILAADHEGVDAKVVFDMPNDKGNDVCYNIDVATSLFKLYARQEGGAPVLMGVTTSWAGLLYSIPMNPEGEDGLQIGVSALSLDMESESEIAWSDYLPTGEKYIISDKIEASRSVLHPGEGVDIHYLDPAHPEGDWSLSDSEGMVVASATGKKGLAVEGGLEKCGSYTLHLKGLEHSGDTPEETERVFPAFIQVTDPSTGSVPRITAFSVNGGNGDILFDGPEEAKAVVEYSAAPGEASLSRGVRLGAAGMGFRFADTPVDPAKSFSISFWFKPDNFDNSALHLMSIRDKGDKWANNNWGWFWHTLNADGTSAEFTLRMQKNGNVTYKFDDTRIVPGVWHHFVYVFDRNDSGNIKAHFYLDGEKQKVTSWYRGDKKYTKEPGFTGKPYGWREDNVAAVGGFLHKSGSVVGNLDNLMLWDHALDSEEVALAMSDVKSGELPAGVAGLFDFEGDAGEDRCFVSEGASGFKGGTHDYLATEVEGQGAIYWTEPEYCAGSPFTTGEAFKLTTSVELTAPGARIVEKNLTPEGGKAVLEYPVEGGYEVGITLSNEYGSDRRMRRVGVGAVGVETVPEEKGSVTVTPAIFTSWIDVEAPADGRFRVMLHDGAGRCVLSNSFSAVAGERMRIYPEVGAGLYVVTLLDDTGRLLGSATVISAQ